MIEDDGDTASFVGQLLEGAGHAVTIAADGRAALFAAFDSPFAAIILDRMLPKIDGMTLVRRLREGGVMAPVLMLTALGGLDDRVAGLDAGADDYLVKPFAPSELLARLSALLRRPAALDTPGKLVLGEIELNLLQRQVCRAGRVIPLQPREFALLAELVRHADRVVTRTMLLERVWNYHFEPQTNIVETHISRLRTKLNAGFDHDPIETVRGEGYRIRG